MRQLLGWSSILFVLMACAGGWYVQRDDARAAAPDAAAFAFADHNLSAAAERIEQLGGILGSYEGIPNDLIVGMTIADATGDRYCVQLMREGAWYFRAGPGGSTQRGEC